MKKNIINIFVRLFCIYVILTLSACGDKESNNQHQNIFEVVYSEDIDIQLAEQVLCEQENTWIMTSVKGDYIYKLVKDTGTLEVKAIECQLQNDNYMLINIFVKNDILYAQLQNKEDKTYIICKYIENEEWRDCVAIYLEEENNFNIVGNVFLIDNDSNIFLSQQGCIKQFDNNGNLKYSYQISGTACTLKENNDVNVECITTEKNRINLYELRQGKAEKRWSFSTLDNVVSFIECSEDGILCLSTNSEILFIDEESGKLLASTDLVRLGISHVLNGYYNVTEGKLNLLTLGEANTGSIKYIVLNEQEVISEKRTELVYGVVGAMNVDASSSIWSAITAFNQENDDYYVSIKNYSGNLERMQADMATGKGPDIIDMTDSEYYESYVKNGYLEDIYPYLEQSQYKDDIIWNVLNAYQVDGGLYLLVPQFRLEGLLIHPEYDIEVDKWNMDVFLSLIEKNKWNKDIFGEATGDPTILLYYMLCGRQNEFIDDKQKTAYFETVDFLDILELCREYMQVDWNAKIAETYEEQKVNSLCLRNVYSGGYLMYLRNVDVYGRNYPIYGYPTDSGQRYGINSCADSCAIYKGSQQKAGAWKFLESLLNESNQRYLGIVDSGFPIRSSILKEMEEEARSTPFRYENETLTIKEEEISILNDIIYNKEINLVQIDAAIWSVIEEETAAYFAGIKSAREVANIIQNRVQIILEE